MVSILIFLNLCLQVFKTVLSTIQEQQVDWYMKLMSPLKQNDLDSVQEIFRLCDQRLAAKESKSIEKQGGRWHGPLM
jgi:nicotinic acid mononucleotide adenylyltransferase